MALAAAIATGRAAFIGTGLNDRDPSGSLGTGEKRKEMEKMIIMLVDATY